MKRKERPDMADKSEKMARVVYVAAGIILSVIVICMSSCREEWWRGEDSGEAYEAYTEQMERVAPDIYGYGW